MTTPSHPQGPTPPENLRDARLAHALQHMPDAHMQPSPQTRSAVLQEALRAASAAINTAPTPLRSPPAVTNPWWHGWLGQPGHRVPWSAAFASLAVVGFITVLWHGKDVPDAAPERALESGTVAQRKIEADASTDTANVPNASMAGRKVAASPPPIAPLTLPPPPSAAVAATTAAKQAAPAEALADAAAPATTTANTAAPAPASAAEANTDSRADSVSKAKSAELSKVARPQAREVVALGESAGARAVASAAPPAPPSAPALAAAPAMTQSYASPTVTIAQSNVKRSVPLEQAQALLSLLRGLTYGTTSAWPKRLESDANRTDWVVEISGQERWMIAPGNVRYQPLSARAKGALAVTGDGVLTSDITSAQYAQLQRLVAELKVQP